MYNTCTTVRMKYCVLCTVVCDSTDVLTLRNELSTSKHDLQYVYTTKCQITQQLFTALITVIIYF